jgi:hypothetical protein
VLHEHLAIKAAGYGEVAERFEQLIGGDSQVVVCPFLLAGGERCAGRRVDASGPAS